MRRSSGVGVLKLTGAFLAVAIAAVSAPPDRAAGLTAACPLGATVNVVAHEDDDLLFLSPDLLHDIGSGRCVRTVFVTAGDSNSGTPRMLLREAAIKSAYAQMAGVANSWTTADAGIGGHPIPLVTLVGRPTVSLVFMRLPNAHSDGSGPSSHNFETPQALWQGSITTMTAIDGSSSYTRTSLTATLTALMGGQSADTIRTQDYVGTFGDGDHPDHHAVAYFARAAHAAYAVPHVLTGYLGYLSSGSPQNVFDPDLAAKGSAFNAYAAVDLICGNPPSCTTSVYWKWALRQYTAGSETGGQATAPPSVSGLVPASGSVGSLVTISGANFTGVTRVAFSGAGATFTVNSPTSITATVPNGATSGPITVTNAAGSATSGNSFTVTAATSSYRSAVLADAPAAYWRLGEANGTTAADASGKGRTGTYTHTPTLAQPGALPADNNTAVAFNGSTQYLQVPYTAALNPTGTFSVEAWVYPTGGQGSFRSVLTSRDVATTTVRGYMLYASSANTWQLWLGTGSAYAKLYGPPIALNSWTHLAATYDGTTARLYVNGTLTATAPLTYTPNTTKPLRIGAGRSETSPDYYLPGRLDEIAIYPTTLTPTRIQTHYQAGTTRPPGPIVAAATRPTTRAGQGGSKRRWAGAQAASYLNEMSRRTR